MWEERGEVGPGETPFPAPFPVLLRAGRCTWLLVGEPSHPALISGPRIQPSLPKAPNSKPLSLGGRPPSDEREYEGPKRLGRR